MELFNKQKLAINALYTATGPAKVGSDGVGARAGAALNEAVARLGKRKWVLVLGVAARARAGPV